MDRGAVRFFDWVRSRTARQEKLPPNKAGGFGAKYEGPFTTPPDEPVELEGELPWELREDKDQTPA
jgi:hypothetical protein